jgi:hypothetical protein
MTALESIEIVETDRDARSGDAWGAIIGGAIAASAVSLILLVLGAGLGLSILSPWTNSTVSSIAVSSVIWLIVVQWVASAVGGYLTGRMREQSEPSDEVFFRDTANGFLAWALATLIAAAVLASATSAVVGTAARIVGAGASAVASAATTSAGSGADPVAYFSDMLLRPLPGSHPETTAVATAAPNLQPPGATEASADLRSEVGRIMVHGIAQQEFPPADLTYLTSVVAARTGLSADAAKQRVDDVVAGFRDTAAKAAAAADTARHQGAKLAIYMFLSLIVGAFIAAVAAALGGVHRNERPYKMA